MHKLTLLLTCVGGVYSYETIRALRSDPELDLRILGVDCDAATTHRAFVDEFALVPSAVERPLEFVGEVLELSRTHGVDVLIPSADEEVLSLAYAREEFVREGVRCAVNDSDKIELLRDKLRLFRRLTELGVDLTPFAGVDKPGDLLGVAEQLGYPAKRLVLKPRTGRGARGLTILDAREAGLRSIGQHRGYSIGNLESASEHLQRRTAPLDLVAMEYLPGAAYDVDCIAREGELRCVVPRRRTWRDPFSPMSQGCRMERNAPLEEMAAEIVRALALNYAVDLDVGTAESGAFGLFEVNPRWSGAVAAGLAAGVNVPSLLVRSIAGLPLPPVELQDGVTVVPVTRMAAVEEGRLG